MLNRIRQASFLIVGCLVGYALGSGPYSEWIDDVYNQLALLWATERISRGPSGTLPLLISGFLIGQGLFLLLRALALKVGPMRAEHAERLSAWDPGLRLASRFGLHQYLQRCVEWASEDPTARTQCLALFKIRGLGALNETRGTVATSELLGHIAAELRAASLPDNVGPFRRWARQNFPRPAVVRPSSLPPPRYPARWSGATFALAFRELDAVQAVAIARDLFNWIRKELNQVEGEPKLSVGSVIVIGSAGVKARGLTRAAAECVAEGQSERVRVLCDPADVRVQVISQMSDVEFRSVNLERTNPDEPPIPQKTADWRAQTRTWGPALGCLISALLLMRVTGGKGGTSSVYFPFPDGVSEVPVFDQSGSRLVHLIRTSLANQQSNTWLISDAVIVQGDPKDGAFPTFQIRAKITNDSTNSYYLSLFDFKAIDANGRKLGFDPQRMVRVADGLTGRWIGPGESLSGWLMSFRSNSPIVGLQFDPDRFTHMSIRSTVPAAPGDPAAR